MPSSSSTFTSFPTLFACGCRYPAPYKPPLFLPPLRHPSTAFSISNSTGNSLLSRMERFLHGSSITRNKSLVEYLKRYGVIKSKKVSEVMETIDRAVFVPKGAPAYEDSPLPIGYNVTISAPHMHAMCLELLQSNLQPGMRALDVGSGTGYLTACFAIMVGPEGRAVGVEHVPELVASSIKNIERSAAAPLLEGGSLSVHHGDGQSFHARRSDRVLEATTSPSPDDEPDEHDSCRGHEHDDAAARDAAAAPHVDDGSGRCLGLSHGHGRRHGHECNGHGHGTHRHGSSEPDGGFFLHAARGWLGWCCHDTRAPSCGSCRH